MGGPSASRTKQAPCHLLRWDSDFFGFPIGRVGGRRLDEARAAAIDEWAWRNDIRCLYFLSDPNDAETARIAERHGFNPVDTRIRLVHDLTALGPRDGSPPIRVAVAEDEEALRPIAARSHIDTRFFADPRFPRRRCESMYATWVVDAIRDPDRIVHVPEVDGRAVGYQVIRPPGKDGEAALELIAIAPDRRRNGLGAALLRSSLRTCDELGAKRVMTITQQRNTVSIEVHRRVGFSAHTEGVWHHRWYGKPDGD
jgi:dTDP-4-amino-4,6-dideoxy-D-galactose acyltransferase